MRLPPGVPPATPFLYAAGTSEASRAADAEPATAHMRTTKATATRTIKPEGDILDGIVISIFVIVGG